MTAIDVAALLARVERLEATEEIRQLAARYAVCLDMRDLDALVNLFVADISVPGRQRGRDALRAWYDEQMRTKVLGTAHGVLGHVIEIDDIDHASGLVYSRNDLDTGPAWVIELVAYLDSYERRDGRWFFSRRTPLFWYECDITQPPVGAQKLRWPGAEWTEGAFHSAFPSWDEFWAAKPGRLDQPVPEPAAAGEWLRALRRGADNPRVNPIGGSDARPAAP